MTDRDALFQMVALDLELGIKHAYTRLQMDDRAPTIYHTSGAAVTHDTCDVAWISLAVARAVPLDFPCATAPLATYRIDIAREWPAVDDQGIPNPEAEQQATFELQRDAAALWELAALCSQKQLISIPELGCDAVRFGDMRPVGPLGGLAGWTFPIDVAIWGLGL
jgi:hypothetical protein